MQITLWEINWLLSGIVIGAVLVWIPSMIIRLHFRKEYDYEDKGIEQAETVKIQRKIQIFETQREIPEKDREIICLPSGSETLQIGRAYFRKIGE